MAQIQQLIASTAGDGYEIPTDTPQWHQTGDGGNNDYILGGWWGFVFESVALANKQLIDSATIDIYGFGSGGGLEMNLRIYGIYEDSAAVWQSDGSNKPSLRNLTTAYVNWYPNWPFAFGRRSTPDISKIIQEIVNRPGWGSGNNIGLVVKDVGTTNGENQACVDYSGSTTNCAQITINYTSGILYTGKVGRFARPIRPRPFSPGIAR